MLWKLIASLREREYTCISLFFHQRVTKDLCTKKVHKHSGGFKGGHRNTFCHTFTIKKIKKIHTWTIGSFSHSIGKWENHMQISLSDSTKQKRLKIPLWQHSISALLCSMHLFCHSTYPTFYHSNRKKLPES